MTIKLFVGKLSFDTDEKTLTDLFAEYGEVTSTAIILDQATKKSKGFGFIEMANLKEAQAAIKELDGKELDGQRIIVNTARPREEGPRRTGGYQKSW